MAFGALDAARALGMKLPQDLSIVGFDDSEITDAITPALTTVAQRALEIGKCAVRLAAWAPS